MKKLSVIFAALAIIAGCTKTGTEEDPTANLVGKTWYSVTGETYTVEEFITVAGSQISTGEHTYNLINKMSFFSSGKGTNDVYYQKVINVSLMTRISQSYKTLGFSWEYKDGQLTISYDTADDILPKQLRITVKYIWNESFSGTFNGKDFGMYTDPKIVEK